MTFGQGKGAMSHWQQETVSRNLIDEAMSADCAECCDLQASYVEGASSLKRRRLHRQQKATCGKSETGLISQGGHGFQQLGEH